MPALEQTFIEKMFATFASKDLDAVMAAFAENALVYDPHYPVPAMQGKPAIRQGFAWAFTNIEKPGFAIRHFWAAENSCVVEVDTHHIFKGGMELKFPQVFIVETRNGLVTRLQAYEPYPPPGLGGLLSTLTRWVWKLQGKIK